MPKLKPSLLPVGPFSEICTSRPVKLRLTCRPLVLSTDSDAIARLRSAWARRRKMWSQLSPTVMVKRSSRVSILLAAKPANESGAPAAAAKAPASPPKLAAKAWILVDPRDGAVLASVILADWLVQRWRTQARTSA